MGASRETTFLFGLVGVYWRENRVSIKKVLIFIKQFGLENIHAEKGRLDTF